MAEYTDLVCKVCGKKFREDDDIVVCHICGTPHHRECYKNLGHCVNEQWHAENKEYNAQEEKEKANSEKAEDTDAEQSGESNNQEKICRRCGNSNSPNAIFCDRCGAPLMMGNGEPGGFQNGTAYNGFPPFFSHNPEEEIDGVKIWKLNAYIRENSFRFVSQFKYMAQRGKKITFNFCAFLFEAFYFFYRKMYGIGIAVLLATLILDIPNIIIIMSNGYLSEMMGMTVEFGIDITPAQLNVLTNVGFITTLFSAALKVFCGLFANWFYFKKCKKTCSCIEAKTREENVTVLSRKGGVNKPLIIFFIGFYVLLTWAGAFFMANPNMFGL